MLTPTEIHPCAVSIKYNERKGSMEITYIHSLNKERMCTVCKEPIMYLDALKWQCENDRLQLFR